MTRKIERGVHIASSSLLLDASISTRQLPAGLSRSSSQRLIALGKEAESLMADGQRILSRLSASRTLAQQIMTAAQSNQKITCWPRSGKPASAASLMPHSIPTAFASCSSAPQQTIPAIALVLAQKIPVPKKEPEFL
ncbi:hypothetical protein PO124_24750 [Bacillus licheniformis]|nr:hypothetical protein [Bacillus licheniformis]